MVIDNSKILIDSLDPLDTRFFNIKVAGPASLVIAKLHKINDRILTSRSSDKDALDLLRLLRKVNMQELANVLIRLKNDSLAGAITVTAVNSISALFSSAKSPGSIMACGGGTGRS